MTNSLSAAATLLCLMAFPAADPARQAPIAVPGSAVQESESGRPDPFPMALVLKAAREYCLRLERAALDFICVEEVSEQVDLSRDRGRNAVTQVPTSRSVTGAGAGGRAELHFDRSRSSGNVATYLFDYQFIRKDGKVTEKRVLLEKNGKKARPGDDFPGTSVLVFADILLGPVTLLNERFAGFYSYRLLDEASLDGRKAWVIEVSPRLSSAGRYLGGKIWLRQPDGCVLRIDWDPATFGHYENILANAEKYKAEPCVVSYTEFGFEKNGLRFPSIDFTEEAYVDHNDKAFVRSQTQVVFKDYKFFTVETEATFKK